MASSDYMPIEYPNFGNTKTQVSETLEWTGRDHWDAIYTIQLGELIEHGIFDWSSPELDWSHVAYSPEQYKRVCDYFIERYLFREISIEPYLEWANMLHRKLTYELMPKYRGMYALLDDGFDLAQDSSLVASDKSDTSSNASGTNDDYHKRRTIGSDYPETLLSGNADYISNGQDEEGENVGETTSKGTAITTGSSNRVTRKNLLDAYLDYEERFTAIDKSLVDKLESLFIGLYTVGIDGM